MVYQLEMPFARAGMKVHRHETFTVQPVAGPVAAVIIAGRQLDRKVNRLEVFVDADLSPNTGVARVGSRIVFPGLGAVFVRQRDSVEYPQTLSCADVEPTDIAFYIVLPARHSTPAVGRADTHDTPSHRRRRA